MKLLKVPLSDGPDVSSAPDRILKHLTGIGLNESGMSSRIEIDPIAVDSGQALSEAIKAISSDARVCLIGGSHRLTYDGFRSFARKNPDAGIIILSARTGCKAGCFLRRLVLDSLVDKSKVILFGTRSWTGEEKEFIVAHSIRHFTMKQITITGMADVIDGLTETINAWPAIYLSIDMSIADPSCAPGTDITTPGGFTSRELIYLIQRLALIRRLKMCDVVGVDPKSDMDDSTSRLAAKIVSELA